MSIPKIIMDIYNIVIIILIGMALIIICKEILLIIKRTKINNFLLKINHQYCYIMNSGDFTHVGDIKKLMNLIILFDYKYSHDLRLKYWYENENNIYFDSCENFNKIKLLLEKIPENNFENNSKSFALDNLKYFNFDGLL